MIYWMILYHSTLCVLGSKNAAGNLSIYVTNGHVRAKIHKSIANAAWKRAKKAFSQITEVGDLLYLKEPFFSESTKIRANLNFLWKLKAKKKAEAHNYLAGQGLRLHGAILEAGFCDKLHKSSCTLAFVWLLWQTDLAIL